MQTVRHTNYTTQNHESVNTNHNIEISMSLFIISIFIDIISDFRKIKKISDFSLTIIQFQFSKFIATPHLHSVS